MSSALSSVPAADAPLLINKRELALRLRVSLPTLTAWIDKWADDFPVVERGTNGLSYRFDARAVFAFLAAKQEAQKHSAAARDQQLAQLVLPFELEGDEARQPGATIKEQIDAVRLNRLKREEAERLRALVSAAEIGDALATAFTSLNRTLHSSIRAAARDLNLPDTIQRRLESAVDNALRATVRDLRRSITSTPTMQDDLVAAE